MSSLDSTPTQPAATPVRPKAPPLSELTGAQRQWIFGGYLVMVGALPGQTVFIGQFSEAIRTELGLTHGQYGGIFTIATMFSAVAMIWTGALADRINPRRLSIISLAILSVLALLMSLATSVWWLGAVIIGLRLLSMGMLPHIATTLMARWFDRFRGRALSFVQLGYSTGEATLPFLIAISIAAIGWRSVWMIAAAAIAVIIIPLILYMFRNAPTIARPGATGTTAVALKGQQWTRRRVLAEPIFLLLLVGNICMVVFPTTLFFFQATLVAEKGWDLLVYTAMIPLLTATGVITALVGGQLVDQLGAYRLTPFFLVPITVGCLLIWLGQGPFIVPVIFVAAGMSAGFAGPVLGALWAELFGTAHLGAIRAIIASSVVFGSGLAPGLVGYLIDAGVPVHQQAPWFSAICLLLTLIYLGFRPRLAELAARRGD